MINGNCDGFVVDYCTTGRHMWHEGSHWEEAMWLCDRHYKLYKEA